MTTKFDTIVIGGGIGGLTAGATLARAGKKVLLLERHYIPGGCATTFKRKDFVMEVGLHEMDGLHELDSKVGIFENLGISEKINFQQAPEVFRFKQNGFDFTMPHGKKAGLKSLIKDFPHEEKAIRKMINLMEGVLREMANFPDGIKAILMYPCL